MKKYIISFLVLLSMESSLKMSGQEFFDKSIAENFFNIGGRIGFNTSNRTFPKGNYSNMLTSSWGIGFNVGAVANLNFREYLSLQPGFFFESRSGNLVNIVDYLSNIQNPMTYYEIDHLRSYNFTIPIMAIVKFNLAENIKWSVELGPYFQFELKETGQNNVNILYREPQSSDYKTYRAKHNGFDAGLKMGMGLQFYSHYYVGFHYLAGFCNAWKNPSGGKNKSWMFAVGYDF